MPTKKRKRRVSRMSMDNCRLEGSVLVLIEYRDGCEHVWKLDLDADETWRSNIIHDQLLKHVRAVRDRRANFAKWADETLAKMGGVQ